jgi:glycosyltransferase involved in cell wall biosynthesis
MEETPEISVVVPISERYDNIKKLYQLNSDELRKIGKTFEFIFVVDGKFQNAYDDLLQLKSNGHPIRIIKFSKHFGESTALMEGFQQATGSSILTLASYLQVEPGDLGKLFAEFDQGSDMVISRRYPRKDPWINRLQSWFYHFLIQKLTKTPFYDITSGMRLIKKEVLSEITLYGDFHRFIPILALQTGFKVKEVKVSHRKEDTQLRIVKPGIYLRRILDILTLFFLVKFTKKPLRFFGLIGSFLSLTGLGITVYLSIMRILGMTALKDRPLLLFGILLIVLGIQIFSAGLVGELIIYSHAKDLKDYSIEEILE